MVWGGVDVLRSVLEAAKWPFERAAWAIERGLIWPLEERTGKWSGPLRAGGVTALALVAAGAGVLGLVWASNSGSAGDTAPRTQISAPIAPPVIKQAPNEAAAPAEPVLQGATPDFTPGGVSATSKSGDAAATKAAEGSTATHAPTSVEDPSLPSASAVAVKAGPAATKVARQFAGAFVLYETGQNSAKVREAFTATATPQLAHSLLRRPPRLPAGVKVPKAKVLNMVPGPKHGDTYTLSVSLLRVGVTSELRIDMQRNSKSGEWQVTDVRG